MDLPRVKNGLGGCENGGLKEGFYFLINSCLGEERFEGEGCGCALFYKTYLTLNIIICPIVLSD